MTLKELFSCHCSTIPHWRLRKKEMAISAMTTKKRAMVMAATRKTNAIKISMATSVTTKKKNALVMAAMAKMNVITTSLAATEKKKEAARMKATMKKKAASTITAIPAHSTGSSTQHSARRISLMISPSSSETWISQEWRCKPLSSRC
jgi:hypothetical protein